MPNSNSPSGTDLESPRELSKKELRSLVDKLLACPSISDRNSREAVLKQLNRQVSQSIQRHPVDKVDVTNIVTTCSSYPGGLQELVDAVEFFEGNSLPMQR